MNRKIVSMMLLILVLGFSSCQVVRYIFETPPPSSEELLHQSINEFKNQSLFNVSYLSLRMNPESFNNKKIRVFGVIIEEFEKNMLLFTNPFEDNEYGFYRIKIDNPLPKQGEFPKPLKYISRGSEVNIFGYYKGLSDIDPKKITDDIKRLNPHIDYSRLRRIPTIEAIIIYDRNDINFQNPIWISKRFLEENYR